MSQLNERTKVVVIDDDHTMTDLLKTTLEPEKFEVYAADSGSEGVNSIEDHDPDVVILDLILPVKSGIGVCREIRSFSQVPIMILSVVSKPGMVEKALDAGADEYLIKPVATNVLLAHLNTLARRARAEKAAANTQENSEIRVEPTGIRHRFPSIF